jgi:hypothetical protein
MEEKIKEVFRIILKPTLFWCIFVIAIIVILFTIPFDALPIQIIPDGWNPNGWLG